MEESITLYRREIWSITYTIRNKIVAICDGPYKLQTKHIKYKKECVLSCQ